MVFKHYEVPYDPHDSFQLSFHHMRHLDCGDQFASSGHRHIPEKQHFPDGVRSGDRELEDMNDVTSNDNSGCTLENTSNLSWVMGSNCEIVWLETRKRSFGDDETQVAAKRTRQMDGNFSPFSSTFEGPFTASMADDDFKSRKDAAVPESATHDSNFSFPWFPYSTSEENSRLEPPVRLSFFPGYYEDHQRPSGYNRVEESQSPVFDYLPRKRVAVGPDHQADIPVWRSKTFQDCRRGDGKYASTSSGHILTDEDSSNKWIGHCVMPMPDSNSLGLDGPLRCGHIDCVCLDEGSIRCVRQHVQEAREELRSILGHELFLEQGICDMGEDVALGWTEEEEELFHKVVASNPASLGKNFWDDLPRAFPSRSSKELVSYYFNVFMLQKRAEQNRSDPLNVDSDNDEWQDSDDDVFGVTEEDEDSGVESPADAAAQDNGVHGDGEVDIHEEAEEDYCEDEEYSISDGFLGDVKSKFGPNVQPMGLNLCDCTGEDQDVHDNSCTSYEDQHNVDHGNLHPEYRNDGVSGDTDHGFVDGHCDSKPWEFGYFHGLDKELDIFLPTCNVIEEVFGNESWEKTREGHGVR